jgi:MoxR-like ATPase
VTLESQESPNPFQVESVAARLEARVREVYVGQPLVVELLLAALGAGAHVLLEGPPGTAKTLLAWAIAHSVGLRFRRVQLTPDLMPSDLLGTSVWLANEGRFEFRPGPLFTDVLLADELNRAPPKTQAALLEAMQEHRVTLDGDTRDLGSSFWVVATQNPFDHEGTYALPESQLDRFAMRIALDYPDAADERDVLQRHRDRGDPMEEMRALLPPAVDGALLRIWRQRVDLVHIDDGILDYIQAIVRATRRQRDLTWGAGPRAGVALLRCSRALALVRERTYVIPDDVRDLVEPALGHRVRLSPEAQIAGLTVPTILDRLVRALPVPAVHRTVYRQ